MTASRIEHCLRLLGLVAAAALATTCATSRPGLVAASPQLAWPAAAPRVRMETTISLEELSRPGRSAWLRRLAGEEGGVPISRPFGLAWDGDDLLVTDAGTGRILRVGAGGHLSASPPASFDSPMDVGVCGGRPLVVDSSAGRLATLDERLRPAEVLLDNLGRPTAVACSGETIWVVETAGHRLLTLRPGGQVETIGSRGGEPGEFNFPTALALDGDSLWVADTLNFRIQRLDLPSGRPGGSFGGLGAAPGEMPRLKGIAVDSSGNIWVSDAHLDQVALFSPDGEYLLSIGGLGSEPGKFSFPAGIAAHPDGRVAVVDSLNRRIQVFRLVERRLTGAVRSRESP